VVRDDVKRNTPTDGAYVEVKKRNGGCRKTRHSLMHLMILNSRLQKKLDTW